MALHEFSRENVDADPDESLRVKPTFFKILFALWETAFIIFGLLIAFAPFDFPDKMEWAILIWIIGCGSGFFWLRKRTYRIL